MQRIHRNRACVRDARKCDRLPHVRAARFYITMRRSAFLVSYVLYELRSAVLHIRRRRQPIFVRTHQLSCVRCSTRRKKATVTYQKHFSRFLSLLSLSLARVYQERSVAKTRTIQVEARDEGENRARERERKTAHEERKNDNLNEKIYNIKRRR